MRKCLQYQGSFIFPSETQQNTSWSVSLLQKVFSGLWKMNWWVSQSEERSCCVVWWYNSWYVCIAFQMAAGWKSCCCCDGYCLLIWLYTCCRWLPLKNTTLSHKAIIRSMVAAQQMWACLMFAFVSKLKFMSHIKLFKHKSEKFV